MVRLAGNPIVNFFSRFFKATIIGGVLFLIPIVLFGLVVQRLLPVARRIVAPIDGLFPAHQVAGIAVGTLLAVAVLILVAFFAGLLARTAVGQDLVAWIDNSLVGVLPQYRLAKSVAGEFVHTETGREVRPVLVAVDGGWRLGLLFDELEDEWVSVFLPDAPHPLSGSVLFVPKGLIRPLDISLKNAMTMMNRLGSGSGKLLRGVNLKDVPGA